VYPTDVVAQDGRRILIVHGTQDRIASQSRSLALARTLSRSAEIGYVSVEGGKHAMLRHHAVFDRLAAEFAVTTLLGDAAGKGAGAHRCRGATRHCVVVTRNARGW
jgi:hypothetical protein